LHGEDYTVAKLDWHASAEWVSNTAGSNKEPVSRLNQQKGGFVRTQRTPPRSAPAQQYICFSINIMLCGCMGIQTMEEGEAPGHRQDFGGGERAARLRL